MKIRERITAIRIIAYENQAESQTKQKSYYDRRSRDRSFEEGVKVLLLLPSASKNLAAKWQGPHEIRRRHERQMEATSSVLRECAKDMA